MSGRIRTIIIFAAGIVLAFVWGLYYVIITAVGFNLDLTLAFLAPTAVAVAGLVIMELYLGRKRKSREGLRV
ncbi:MAG: hypothetical protein OK441_02760 [Thaumarchaeota archaeon]|nr:hypothetical protein [Nitrososphaerota archaeon]